MSISPLAVVGKNVRLGEGVEIGPFAIIEDGADIGARTMVYPHAFIAGTTTIGEECRIHMGAVIGHEPQDLAFKGLPSYTKIGKKTVIREYATIHRGTAEGTATVIGDECYLMANAHVAHNCQIGNRVIIVNAALLAGYVTVEDAAFISGGVVVHQFCRIGKLAMIGGYTAVNKDAPPYMLVRGPSVVRSVNLVGLRRAKFAPPLVRTIKDAFKLLFMSDLNTTHALDEIAKLPASPELDHLVSFIKSSKRGICRSKEHDEESFA